MLPLRLRRSARGIHVSIATAFASALFSMPALAEDARGNPAASKPAAKSARELTLETLDAIAASGSRGLRLGANAVNAQVDAGDPIVFQLDSDRRAFVTLLHVDARGVVTLILPSDLPRASLIQVGASRLLPESEDLSLLRARPGQNDALALATPRPIPRDWLASEVPAAHGLVEFAPDEGPRLAARLEKIVAGLARAEFSAARLTWTASDNEELPPVFSMPGPPPAGDGSVRRGSKSTSPPPTEQPFPKVPDRDELDLLGVPDPEELD